MKLSLAIVAGLGAGVAFAAAEYYSVRPEASFLDRQWVFLAALPYNWSMLRLTGESNFTNESAAQVVAAGLFDVALAFVFGLFVEAAARALARAALRLTGRA